MGDSYNDSRYKFIDLCLNRLSDNDFEKRTGFRKAFFRNVETWRLNKSFIDITYYLNFSALEILCRVAKDEFEKDFAEVANGFLREHGFNVKRDAPKTRPQALQTYADLRNMLFHNGEFEKVKLENNKQITLKLSDYISYLERLVPDALLKVSGFEDESINWNRWLDRQPFK